MALLTEKERKEAFEILGYEYNEDSIRKIQKKYMSRKSDVDGKWGVDTDNLVRTLVNVKEYCKNFTADEFKCECGGKYCCGYPDYMKPSELQHIQKIRDHFGRPIRITSGLRCKGYNRALNGSVENSGHLQGLALDFYQAGVTDTVTNRKNAMKWIKTLPNHKFTYGKGMNDSNGVYRTAAYMGNAMHTETSNTVSSQLNGKLNVDGVGGGVTIIAAQKHFGTPQDGVIDGQDAKLGKYYPSIVAVKYGTGGSQLVRTIQIWSGANPDGVWGKATSIAVQSKLIALGYSVGKSGADGIFGTDSMKAFQRYLNENDVPAYTKRYKDDVIDVSNFQESIDWDKAKTEGIAGAIIKCGFRGGEKGYLTVDTKFFQYIKGAYDAGLKVGVYFFTEAVNAQEGMEEAAYTMNLIRQAGYPLSYPVAIDTENVFWYEEKSGKKVKCKGRANSDVLSKAKRTEAIKAFCETIKAQGYTPMIYASLSWLNNQLDMSQLPYYVWVAQYASKCDYKDDYVMWQYTSSGKLSGIAGDVDVSHCYLKDTTPKPIPDPTPEPEPEPEPQPEPTPGGYTGELPTMKMVKTNQQVINDTCAFASWIAGDNSFHYGHGKDAHHNGCYFCGTQPKSKKTSGIVDWQKTYCCNPYVHAAWAHGGCVPALLKMCMNGKSLDQSVKSGYEKSKLFDKLGKPKKNKLKKGDVLVWDRATGAHVMIMVSDTKIAEAASADDNKRGSKKWNNSIHITELTDARYKQVQRVYRFNGFVDTMMPIRHGEVSDRVKLMQDFLIWKGYLTGKSDRFFGDMCYDALKRYQADRGLEADGIAGVATLAQMEKDK